MAAPIKNNNRPDKIWRDALMVAIKRVSAGGRANQLAIMADKLVELACEGDVAAIKEIGDRIDGKPTQMLAADPEKPMTLLIGVEKSLNDKLDRLLARRVERS